MRRNLAVIVMALIFLSYAMQGPLLAQEEEELEYSWGTVKSVSSDQIVVTEYDYDNDKEIEVTYSLDPKLEIVGVESLNDIKAGDNLEIDYKIQGDKRTVKFIAVEKLSETETEE